LKKHLLYVLNFSIELCKEVADGLRIYFDFTLKDHLLYNEEKDQYKHVTSDSFRETFTPPTAENLIPDFLSVLKQEPPDQKDTGKADESLSATTQPTIGSPPKVIRHRLRSRNDENEFMFDLGASTGAKAENLSSVASTSSEGMTSNPQTATSISILKSILPLNIGISSFAKEMLDDVFAWRMLPEDGPFEVSHIYGAVHLARLIGRWW
jgi:male-specific lethal 3